MQPEATSKSQEAEEKLRLSVNIYLNFENDRHVQLAAILLCHCPIINLAIIYIKR